MSKRLVIAEKPSVARDIAEALGPFTTPDGDAYYETAGYVISYAVGHLLELNEPHTYDEKWKIWSLKRLPILPEEFALSPRDTRAKKRLSILKRLAKRKDVTSLVNACDAGREGEHIFRTIADELPSDLPAERLWLSSLTRGAIQAGFSALRPSADFEALGDAARSRSEADWLIGINATRALSTRLKSLRYQGAWTAGRVQTPTLTMLVDRELEIFRHRPRAYWRLKATFAAQDDGYEGIYFDPKAPRSSDRDIAPDRVFDKERADTLAAIVAAAKTAEASEKRARKRENAPLPFDLTSLQRAANSRIGYSARRTLEAAQRLYEEHKLLSYPRTDSRYLPQDQRPALLGALGSLSRVDGLGAIASKIHADGLQNTDRVFDDSKVTDHYAIMPLGAPAPGQLSENDARIFELVVRQFLAAFMKPAWWAEVRRETVVTGGGERLTFRSSGRMLEEAGWQMAFGRAAGHGSSLSPLQPAEGATVDVKGHELDEKVTLPPARLTEAGLLNRMENCGKEVDDASLSEALRERGLGTPATRADIIERLIDKGYVVRLGKSMRPTAKAIRLVEILRLSHADILASVELTGEMERQLREVAEGSADRASYMQRVGEETLRLVDTLRDFDFDAIYVDTSDLGPCPGDPTRRVKETAWGYACEDRDGADAFFIWKDVRGHVLQAHTMRELLANEELTAGPIPLYPQGSSRRAGSGYEAMLKLRRLDDEAYGKLKTGKRTPSRWRIEVLVEGETAPAEKADATDESAVANLCACPSRDGATIVETEARYVDEAHVGSADRPLAVLPKIVCQRPISREEAASFFEEGRTVLLSGFISKRGRPFNAILLLKDNGRHGFEFEKRKPRAKKKTGAKGGARKRTSEGSRKAG